MNCHIRAMQIFILLFVMNMTVFLFGGNMKKKKIGLFLMIIGIILILIAALLVGYNIKSDRKAEIKSEKVMEILKTEYKLPKLDEYIPVSTDPTVLPEINEYEDLLFKNEKSENIDGNSYIGIIQIPSLEIELPVQKEWTYNGLKISPCRYSGSADENNLLIAAHNYSGHFGNINKLVSDDVIRFIDLSGDVYVYQVDELITIDGKNIEEMINGDWDLTLFTCTLGGQSRVTVRCSLVNKVIF